MKLKLGVFLIIVSTALVIGIMSISLNRSSSLDAPATTDSKPPRDTKKHLFEKPEATKTGQHLENKPDKKVDLAANDDVLDDDEDDDVVLDGDDDEDEDEDDVELTKEDIQKINNIVSLSENELASELNVLKGRIEEEDLFGKLEDGLLTGDKEVEAKEVLERFALLGLEGTRRKYMAVEPELKDPMYAYKDSLMEIRELLNDNYDDE